MAAVEFSAAHVRRLIKYRANVHGDGRDPTQTTTLRRRWAGEAYRRFRDLKGILRFNIVEQDVLGIKQAANPTGVAPQQSLDAQQSPSPFFPEGAHLPVQRFDFPQDAQKVDEFMAWLDEMVTAGILEVAENPAQRAVGTTSAWQNLYIRQAYSKGLVHAEHAMRQIGVTVPDETLEMLFRGPRHANKVGLLYTRAFGELDGVTDAMAQEIRRTLSEGLTQGWGADKMARELNDRVSAIGINRSRTIARTETVRAVNEAALTRYEGQGIERVGALVEFITAGDVRVCPICQSLNGSTMRIDQARGLIPVHPNCRCMWLPVPPGETSRVSGIGPADLAPVVPVTVPSGSPRSPGGTPGDDAPRPAPSPVKFEDIGVEALDDTADEWARAVDTDDIRPLANPLDATDGRHLDETNIGGGVNAQNMWMLDTDDGRVVFLKEYEDDALGTAKDGHNASTIIRRMGGRAPQTSYLDIEGVPARPGVGQLALEGVDRAEDLVDAYDRVDPRDLARQLAHGTLVRNTDMHNENLMVGGRDLVWLVDNDISMDFVEDMGRRPILDSYGSLEYTYAKRIRSHGYKISSDPEDMADMWITFDREMLTIANEWDGRLDELFDGLDVSDAVKEDFAKVLRTIREQGTVLDPDVIDDPETLVEILARDPDRYAARFYDLRPDKTNEAALELGLDLGEYIPD